MAKIDRSLNLVSIVERDTIPLYVYSTPLPYEVVEANHVLLGHVFSKFHQDVGQVGAPRVAAMMLRSTLRAAQQPGQTGPTILDDIARLTNVVAWDDGKWKQYPLDVAISRGVITLDEWRDVEGEVCFFMVSCAIQKRSLIPAIVGSILSMYSAQLTASDCSEFRSSLLSPTEELPPVATTDQQEEVTPAPVTTGTVRIPC